MLEKRKLFLLLKCFLLLLLLTDRKPGNAGRCVTLDVGSGFWNFVCSGLFGVFSNSVRSIKALAYIELLSVAGYSVDYVHYVRAYVLQESSVAVSERKKPCF